ncbi:MAG: hypothetical protein ACJA1I_000550 [Zhongshania marina]|jgi:hypothetical protein
MCILSQPEIEALPVNNFDDVAPHVVCAIADFYKSISGNDIDKSELKKLFDDSPLMKIRRLAAPKPTTVSYVGNA